MQGRHSSICGPELHLSKDMEVTGETAAVQSQSCGASERTWHLAPIVYITGSSPVLHLQLGWQV